MTIDVAADVFYENNETFTVELSSAANAAIADGIGSGTITNDDAQPSFSISDVTQNEGNSGTTNFALPSRRPGQPSLLRRLVGSILTARPRWRTMIISRRRG